MKTTKACIYLMVWATILIAGYFLLEPISAEDPWMAVLIGIGFISAAMFMSRIINDSVKNPFNVVVVAVTWGAISLVGGLIAHFTVKSYDLLQSLQSIMALSIAILASIGADIALARVRKPSKNLEANQT